MKFKLSGNTIPMNHFFKEASSDRTFHQIVATKDIPVFGVKEGDLGGWVEHVSNLEQEDDSWIYEGGISCGNATIKGSSTIGRGVWVSDDCIVSDFSHFRGNIRLNGSHRFERVDANVNEFMIMPDTKGTWVPFDKNKLLLRGDIYVHAKLVKWSAAGTIDALLELHGEEVMVSGVIDASECLNIKDSHLANAFSHGDVRIDESHIVGLDGNHHLFKGKVSIFDSSIHGFLSAESSGGEIVLKETINEGMTDIQILSDGYFEANRVRFLGITTLIHDSPDNVGVHDKSYSDEVYLRTSNSAHDSTL
ncbi:MULTISPECIES: hypothetical protein [unclassified Exiguobacterium]|uniref:hypothetical protein n=1 Tax=unclassified Exiguobacterium TaxID=2644629 RepID=UPI001BEC1CBB|nr:MULTISPECIES: hypothetical protein [unclassified Exiguobacterium]